MPAKNTAKALIPRETIEKIDRLFQSGLASQEAEALQDPQAFRLSIARRRYREGFTNKIRFLQELRTLQVPPDQVELEVIAGDLEASYDYSMDLIATYRDAFRKGNISIDKFAELITKIVVVPERSQTYVARELARLKPEEAPTLEPVAKATYETEPGKVEVDTIRRERRKKRITREEELVRFTELGVPVELAQAWADNDDARLAEKGGEE